MTLSQREEFIILLDHEPVIPSDAIILLEGDGLSRVRQVVSLYKDKLAPKILFSGGVANEPDGSFPASIVVPELVRSGIADSDILVEEISKNTRQQAIEVLALAKRLGWKRIILVASHYHHYRAFLTFLKAHQELNSEIIIGSAPCRDLAWFRQEPWGSRIELLTSEFNKIERYAQLGHVATYHQAIEYQKWKESQM